ncbi:MAG: acylphosphatase [Planctomycetota bacterium]
MKRVEVRYTGRVQGVGFRAATQDAARTHGVLGWVRNDPDGTVSLVAEGEPDVVDAYLDAVAERLSQFIEREDRGEAEPRGTYDTFEIR